MNHHKIIILILVLVVICCLAFFMVPKCIKRIQVVRWVEKYPEPSAMESATDPYMEWIEAGRKIKGIEKVLLSLCKHNTTNQQTVIIIGALYDLGTEKSTPVLIKIMEDKERIIWERREAAASLGGLGDRNAVSPLCRMALSDDDLTLRMNATISLYRIGDPKGIPVIEKFLETQQLTGIDKVATEQLLEQFREKVGLQVTEKPAVLIESNN